MDEEEGDLQAPDVQVTQSVNVIPLLQGHLATVEAARHPHQAALPLAQMYYLLESLRELDAAFERRWKTILDGDFNAWASRLKWRMDLEWQDIWAAKSALLRLLDRRGMLYKVMGHDPLTERHEAFTAELQSERED